MPALRWKRRQLTHPKHSYVPIQANIQHYLLTYSMVQSPSWEANWFAASQEFPRISRNPKVHYRTHKRPQPVSILGQPNPVHIPTSHLLESHPNIIHPSTPRYPQWSLSLRFPRQDPIHPLSSPIRATFPTHLVLLDFISRTILGEENIQHYITQKRNLHIQCHDKKSKIVVYVWLPDMLTWVGAKCSKIIIHGVSSVLEWWQSGHEVWMASFNESKNKPVHKRKFCR